MIDEIYEVARTAAAQESWKVGEEMALVAEKRWPLGPVAAWRVEFTRHDREAVGFVRVDAKTLEVISTGWRAAEPTKVAPPRAPVFGSIEEALARAAA